MSHCIVLDVDGEPVRFQLTVPPDQLTDTDREGLIELARFVRSRHVKPESGDAPLATPTPIATHGPNPTGHLDVPRMPLPPQPPAEDE